VPVETLEQWRDENLRQSHTFSALVLGVHVLADRPICSDEGTPDIVAAESCLPVIVETREYDVELLAFASEIDVVAVSIPDLLFEASFCFSELALDVSSLIFFDDLASDQAPGEDLLGGLNGIPALVGIDDTDNATGGVASTEQFCPFFSCRLLSSPRNK
jgi:hypothetical protein